MRMWFWSSFSRCKLGLALLIVFGISGTLITQALAKDCQWNERIFYQQRGAERWILYFDDRGDSGTWNTFLELWNKKNLLARLYGNYSCSNGVSVCTLSIVKKYKPYVAPGESEYDQNETIAHFNVEEVDQNFDINSQPEFIVLGQMVSFLWNRADNSHVESHNGYRTDDNIYPPRNYFKYLGCRSGPVQFGVGPMPEPASVQTAIRTVTSDVADQGKRLANTGQRASHRGVDLDSPPDPVADAVQKSMRPHEVPKPRPRPIEVLMLAAANKNIKPAASLTTAGSQPQKNGANGSSSADEGPRLKIPVQYADTASKSENRQKSPPLDADDKRALAKLLEAFLQTGVECPSIDLRKKMDDLPVEDDHKKTVKAIETLVKNNNCDERILFEYKGLSKSKLLFTSMSKCMLNEIETEKISTLIACLIVTKYDFGSKSNLAFSYYKLAKISRLSGLYDLSNEELEKAIQLNPASADFYVVRAQNYMDKQWYGLARVDLDTAIKLDADNADAYYTRSVLHQMTGDRDSDATKDLRKAKSLKPSTFDVVKGNMGTVNYILREKKGAFSRGKPVLQIELGPMGERPERDRANPSISLLSFSDKQLCEHYAVTGGQDRLFDAEAISFKTSEAALRERGLTTEKCAELMAVSPENKSVTSTRAGVNLEDSARIDSAALKTRAQSDASQSVSSLSSSSGTKFHTGVGEYEWGKACYLTWQIGSGDNRREIQLYEYNGSLYLGVLLNNKVIDGYFDRRAISMIARLNYFFTVSWKVDEFDKLVVFDAGIDRSDTGAIMFEGSTDPGYDKLIRKMLSQFSTGRKLKVEVSGVDEFETALRGFSEALRSFESCTAETPSISEQ